METTQFVQKSSIIIIKCKNDFDLFDKIVPRAKNYHNVWIIQYDHIVR